MTGNRTVSEDLVQDVFFRILKYRNTYRGGQFITWMYHIARNTRADYFKKVKFELAPLEGHIEIPSHRRSVAEEFEFDQQTQALRCALMKLPENKRELLILARYQGMKYEQIAELLAVDVGTIKVRVHRTLKELSEIFLKLANEKPPCNAKKPEINFPII